MRRGAAEALFEKGTHTTREQWHKNQHQPKTGTPFGQKICLLAVIVIDLQLSYMQSSFSHSLDTR